MEKIVLFSVSAQQVLECGKSIGNQVEFKEFSWRDSYQMVTLTFIKHVHTACSMCIHIMHVDISYTFVPD